MTGPEPIPSGLIGSQGRTDRVQLVWVFEDEVRLMNAIHTNNTILIKEDSVFRIGELW